MYIEAQTPIYGQKSSICVGVLLTAYWNESSCFALLLAKVRVHLWATVSSAVESTGLTRGVVFYAGCPLRSSGHLPLTN